MNGADPLSRMIQAACQAVHEAASKRRERTRKEA
jgi:hypothetical protein